MMKRLISIVLLAALAGGCTTHGFGDGRIENISDWGGVTTDRFYLKPVPLDRAATYTMHVQDLPFAIYPTHLLLPITPAEAEMKGGVPWEKTRLQIEFRTPTGQPFFSKEVALRDAKRGVSPGTVRQLVLQFRPVDRHPWRTPEGMPNYVNYDVVVRVLEPSENKNHSVQLYADTYVR